MSEPAASDLCGQIENYQFSYARFRQGKFCGLTGDTPHQQPMLINSILIFDQNCVFMPIGILDIIAGRWRLYCGEWFIYTYLINLNIYIHDPCVKECFGIM